MYYGYRYTYCRNDIAIFAMVAGHPHLRIVNNYQYRSYSNFEYHINIDHIEDRLGCP